MAIDLSLMSDLIARAGIELKGASYLRPIFKKLVSEDRRILEIGAGAFPLFERKVHKNYKILDYYSSEEIAHHFEVDYGIEGAKSTIFPEVDYVCKDGVISQCVGDDKFDIVYSSHSIEHQPCLITHLKEIEKILAPGAIVAMIVPDKEHTFDALRQPTTTGDVLAAFHSGNRTPRGKDVFEFYARHINLNPGRKIEPQDSFGFSHRLHEAYEKFKNSISSNSSYFDIHNWVFSPKNFVLILVELHMLGLIKLFPQIVSDIAGNEFLCIMNIQSTPAEQEISVLDDFRLQTCRDIFLSKMHAS